MGRMNEDNLEIIKSSWRELYQHDKGRGKNAGIVCPICGSGSGPNGSGIKLNPKSKGYSLKCFGCDFSGDVIDLKAKELGVDVLTAYKYLCDELGLSVEEPAELPIKRTQPKPTPKPQEPAEQPQPLVDYREYYKTAAEALNGSQEAQSYLSARGISMTLAQRVQIGFDAAWISPTVCREMEAKGESWRPNPKPVIVLPVTKNHYITRDIRPKDTIPERERQYVKLHEIGNGEVGIWRLTVALKSPGEALFITEGIFDALSIIEAGAEAIALNSTSNIGKLGEKLPAALDKYPEARKKKYIIALDNDEPGRRATAKLSEVLEAAGVSFLQADLTGGTEGADVNDVLVTDRTALAARVKEAIEAARNVEAPEQIEDEHTAEPGGVLTFLDKIQTEAYKPYKTGLSFFDELLGGGVLRQSLSLLLAAPGTGKTTLCQQLAEAMARNGKPVIYLNLEMSQEQMLAKAFSQHLAEQGKFMTAENVLQGYSWTDEQRANVMELAKDYQENVSPWLQYNPAGIGTDLDKIMEYLNNVGAAALAGKRESPAIFLDYLHLVTSARGLETQELIKQVVAGLKNYAIRFNTIAFGIVATNREANKAGRISASSARDSSALEYTADTILALNYEALDQRRELEGMKADAENPEYMAILQHQQPRQMIIRVLKARLGQPGASVLVDYDAAHNIFREQSMKDKGFVPASKEEQKAMEELFVI